MTRVRLERRLCKRHHKTRPNKCATHQATSPVENILEVFCVATCIQALIRRVRPLKCYVFCFCVESELTKKNSGFSKASS